MEEPTDFNFPFEPYDIQTAFMSNVFQCLKEEKLGIFESPTGTGKSLSLICGALTWFMQYEKHRKLQLQRQIDDCNALQNDDNGEDWFSAAVKQSATRDKKHLFEKELKTIKVKEERMQELKMRRNLIKRSEYDKIGNEFDELFKDVNEVRDAIKKELNMFDNNDMLNEEEKEFAPKECDYNSDESDDGTGKEKKWNEIDDEDDDDFSLRIFYCSRTHSQLSQFVKEIQKTSFKNDIRLVSLASRANMCINESVRKIGNTSLINETCLELQKKKGSKSRKRDDNGKTTKKQKCSSGCPYFKQEAIRSLQDQTLLEVQDIEQLVTKGRTMKACPYYASRAAISDAQIVVLPYNTLLHKVLFKNWL
jgi:chromosome transmission fidelity protein 1